MSFSLENDLVVFQTLLGFFEHGLAPFSTSIAADEAMLADPAGTLFVRLLLLLCFDVVFGRSSNVRLVTALTKNHASRQLLPATTAGLSASIRNAVTLRLNEKRILTHGVKEIERMWSSLLRQ